MNQLRTSMTSKSWSGGRLGAAVFLIIAVLAGLPTCVQAQFPGFQFGGGGGQQGSSSRSRSSSGQYPNNQVGDAVITVDPSTRKLIVIADEDTQKWVSQVVSNLNRPQPQVLI